MVRTGLVLNNQLQLLEIFAVGIASSASKSEVGSQARVCDINIGSCVPWARSRVCLSRKNEGSSVVRVRRGKSEARARRKRNERLDQHGALRLSSRCKCGGRGVHGGNEHIICKRGRAGAGYKWAMVTMTWGESGCGRGGVYLHLHFIPDS